MAANPNLPIYFYKKAFILFFPEKQHMFMNETFFFVETKQKSKNKVANAKVVELITLIE